eukprot:403353971
MQKKQPQNQKKEDKNNQIEEEENKFPNLLKDKYLRLRIIGKGANSTVLSYQLFNGINLDSEAEEVSQWLMHKLLDRINNVKDKFQYAVKFEEINESVTPMLLKESLLYKKMSLELKQRNVPMYIEHGHVKQDSRSYNYLVMERLDSNLFDFVKDIMDRVSQDQKFFFMRIVIVRLIESLQEFHATGYVHQDIKPQSIMIRDPSIQEAINGQIGEDFCFINLGIAQEYKVNNGSHKIFRQTEVIKGAILFASQNSLMMNELSRRDDLESLFLTIIYIINKVVLAEKDQETKGFPYEGEVNIPENINLLQPQQKTEQIMKFKTKVDQYLFKQNHSCPLIIQLVKCIQIARSLKFEEEPNYQKLVQIISENDEVDLEKMLKTRTLAERVAFNLLAQQKRAEQEYAEKLIIEQCRAEQQRVEKLIADKQRAEQQLIEQLKIHNELQRNEEARQKEYIREIKRQNERAQENNCFIF